MWWQRWDSHLSSSTMAISPFNQRMCPLLPSPSPSWGSHPCCRFIFPLNDAGVLCDVEVAVEGERRIAADIDAEAMKRILEHTENIASHDNHEVHAIKVGEVPSNKEVNIKCTYVAIYPIIGTPSFSSSSTSLHASLIISPPSCYSLHAPLHSLCTFFILLFLMPHLFTCCISLLFDRSPSHLCISHPLFFFMLYLSSLNTSSFSFVSFFYGSLYLLCLIVISIIFMLHLGSYPLFFHCASFLHLCFFLFLLMSLLLLFDNSSCTSLHISLFIF